MVVLKVASSLMGEPSKYWPPSLPDAIETIAASYILSATTSMVRLFNLSPDTKAAGLACSANNGTLVKDVLYSLGSKWYAVEAAASTYTVADSMTGAVLASRTETPPPAPLAFTTMLIGLQKGSGATAARLISLNDAPEGGVCKP